MKNKIISVILIAIMCFVPYSVNADEITERARILYDLGLLKGTGEAFSRDSLELDRNATRAEMCTTVVRMLGKEQKAAYQQNSHPFFDVPSWASNNIGWLYENYLVNGESDTYFGAEDIATVQQFCTMLLRVLGYDDSAGDFYYNDAVNFAVKCGIADSSVKVKYELSRCDMFMMCYNALRVNINNSSRPLIKKLCDERAVSYEHAKRLGLLKTPELTEYFNDVPQTLGVISVKQKTSGVFCVTLNNAAEEYGLRVYVLPEDGMLAEIPYSGNIYMKKGQIDYPGGSSAGYLKELYVYGLDTSKKYSFIVIKTSSEGELYHTIGKSAVCKN